MNNVLLIARRELGAYLRTMSGYIIIALMLLVDGLLFNGCATVGVAKKSSEVLADFFYLSSGIGLIGAIFLSMRLLAEERQTGTIQLLYSSPVNDLEIVLGKFLSALAFLALFLAASLYIPALVFAYGKVSLGHLAAGYLGLLLLGAMCMAVGTFGSALTKSQVVAAVLTAVMLRHHHPRLVDRQGHRPAAHRRGGHHRLVPALQALRAGPGAPEARRLLPPRHLRGALRVDAGARSPAVEVAMKSSFPLSILYALGWVAFYVGERLVDPGASRLALDLLAGALILGATAWRFTRGRSPRQGANTVERWLLLLQLTGRRRARPLPAAVGRGHQAARHALETSSPKLAGVLSVLWPAVLACALFPMLLIELSYAAMAQSAFVEVGRVRDAMLSGLGIALALVFAFSLEYVVGERDVKVDLSYFRTTKPGEATQALVQSFDET